MSVKYRKVNNKESVEKLIFFRLIKNAPACAEASAGRCKLSLRNPVHGGAREAFHLPFRQAILRVASRRIRSDILRADELVSRQRRTQIFAAATNG